MSLVVYCCVWLISWISRWNERILVKICTHSNPLSTVEVINHCLPPKKEDQHDCSYYNINILRIWYNLYVCLTLKLNIFSTYSTTVFIIIYLYIMCECCLWFTFPVEMLFLSCASCYQVQPGTGNWYLKEHSWNYSWKPYAPLKFQCKRALSSPTIPTKSCPEALPTLFIILWVTLKS